MSLQKSYTALLTADLESGEAWYTKLLGRAPDYRPIDTLVQWELSRQADYSTLAQVRDPDGNLLTLASPPSRAFPAA